MACPLRRSLPQRLTGRRREESRAAEGQGASEEPVFIMYLFIRTCLPFAAAARTPEDVLGSRALSTELFLWRRGARSRAPRTELVWRRNWELESEPVPCGRCAGMPRGFANSFADRAGVGTADIWGDNPRPPGAPSAPL